MTRHPSAPAPEPSDELLARYLSGECDAVERRQVEQWVAADPARARLLGEMRDAWAAPTESLAGWDAAAMQARLAARLGTAAVPVTPLHRAVARPPQRGRWVGMVLAGAAAAALVVATVRSVERVGAPRAAAVASADVDSSRFSTRPGQRATVTLTDGSTVVLGAQSRLSIAPGFGGARRVVVLDGEAYFDVARDSTKAFVVVAGGTETRVLGTAFAVLGRAGDSVVSVAVVRGRVGIGAGAAARQLRAGDVGRTMRDGRTSMRHDPLQVAALTGWKDGWLTLVDARVDDAAAVLSRWYDLDVQLGDARLRGRRISASFRNESADAVLRSIGEVLDVRIERAGRTVTLHSR